MLQLLKIFKQVVTMRQWNAEHSGVYVKQKEGLSPNIYLENNHLHAKDGTLLVKINRA